MLSVRENTWSGICFISRIIRYKSFYHHGPSWRGKKELRKWILLCFLALMIYDYNKPAYMKAHTVSRRYCHPNTLGNLAFLRQMLQLPVISLPQLLSKNILLGPPLPLSYLWRVAKKEVEEDPEKNNKWEWGSGLIETSYD